MNRLTLWPNDSPRATGRVIGAGAGPDYAESHPGAACARLHGHAISAQGLSR